jgi:hypothetical protein
MHEVFIIEDIRGRANQPEADLLSTLIARGKKVFTVEDRFMSNAMALIVDDLVNTGFRDW